MMSNSQLKNNLKWRQNGNHLPKFMRDWHDQKYLFKAIVSSFGNHEDCSINFMVAHTFTIDWFLWFMAIHGYKLTKTTAKVEHLDINEAVKSGWDYRL